MQQDYAMSCKQWAADWEVSTGCLLGETHPQALAADPAAVALLPQVCCPPPVGTPGCDWSPSLESQGGCRCRLLSKPKPGGRVASLRCRWSPVMLQLQHWQPGRGGCGDGVEEHTEPRHHSWCCRHSGVSTTTSPYRPITCTKRLLS